MGAVALAFGGKVIRITRYFNLNPQSPSLILDLRMARPLVAVYYRARWEIQRGEAHFPQSLLTLVKHAFFTDWIGENAISRIETKLERLTALWTLYERGATPGEQAAALKGAQRLALAILEKEIPCRIL